MAFLSERRKARIFKNLGIIVFRCCDECNSSIKTGHYFTGRDGKGDYDTEHCRNAGDEKRKLKEKEERKLNRKKEKLMSKDESRKKHAKSSDSGSHSGSGSGSNSGSASASNESSSQSQSKSASQSSEEKGKRMSSKEKKGKSSSSKKEKTSKEKKSSSSSKKDSKKKEAKPKGKNGKEGNYRAGSIIATLFERLSGSKGKAMTFKEAAKGIKGDIMKPLNRLVRHGERSKLWDLTIDKENETVRMKMKK